MVHETADSDDVCDVYKLVDSACGLNDYVIETAKMDLPSDDDRFMQAATCC